MDGQDMKICQKHKLELILVDLEAKIAQEDRILCIRCIIERMDKKKINLVDETRNMIKEMKINEQNQRIKDNKKRLDNLNGIEQLLRELKQIIDSIFDKIFNTIQLRLSQIQKDICNIESQSILSNFQDDIERLSQYQEYQINEQSIKMFEDDHKFIEQIQKQLESFINSEQYDKLINDSNIVKKSQIEQDLINNEYKYEIKKAQDYKTPALKIICQEHTKEIIMLNLNAFPILNQEWLVLNVFNNILHNILLQKMSRNQTNLCELQNTRNSIKQKILKLIQDIKLQNDQIFDELIQSLFNQEQSIELMNQNEIRHKSIYQLTTKQINEIINQLSQIDKFKIQNDYKMNIEKIDQIFYSDLRSRFEHLIQYQQINVQRFNQILTDDNKVINEMDNLLQSIQDNKNESIDINQIIEQIRQFMNKTFNFEFSQKLFIQTIDQYIKIKEEMRNLQQLVNNKIENSQEFQRLSKELNNYSDKFNEDCIQFDQFLKINQKQNEITELKEQFEIIQKAKQEQKTQFQTDLIKIKEQINQQNLESKNTFEKQINAKEDNIKYLTVQIEQIKKENLYLEQNEKQFCSYLQNIISNSSISSILLLLQSSQYQKQLTFSQTHKHSSCEVTQNGKIVQQGYFCLCDQAIPKNGVTSFAIKIMQLNQTCFIGIGIRDIIQRNKYCGDVTYGYGSYTIGQDKYCFSHHQQDKNWYQQSFDFTINDVIIVEVDIQNKNIKWIKANTNQSFSLQIETTYDLYPCLWVCGNGSGNKVQILE